MAQTRKNEVGKNPRALGSILVMVMFACLGLVVGETSPAKLADPIQT